MTFGRGSAEVAMPSDDVPDRVRGHRRWLAVAVATIVVAVDQLTKWLALNGLDDGPIDLVWTLRLNLHFNPGFAFSLGEDIGPVLAVAALVVAIGLVSSPLAVRGNASAVAVGAIAGGAVGNVLDRIFRASDGFLSGEVVDFIDFQWWPVFNFADTAIVLGAVALLLVYRGVQAGERA